MRFLLLFIACLVSVGCGPAAVRKGILCTAGDWDIPPAYHGNPWAPGGVGAARSYVYEALFDYTPATRAYYPRLGTSFEETPDRLTVHLRTDARWHDGEPFTSADVRATFVIGQLAGLEITYYLDDIETPDPATVVFRWRRHSPTNTLQALTEPITTAAHLFGPYVKTIEGMREKPADAKAEAAAREVLFAERPPLPVGTGPFRLSKVTASDMLLERFAGYYKPIAIDQVRIARWGRNEVVWSYLYAGQLDAVSPACPYDLAQEILRRNPQTRLVTPSDMNEMGLVLNTRRPPLDRLDTRRAIAASIDRDAIRRLASATGDTSPAYSIGIVPSQAAAWLGADFVQGLTTFPYDRAHAEQLLTSMGWTRTGMSWSGARPLEIIAPAGFSDLALLAEAASNQLARFGIPCSVRLVQGEMYDQMLAQGNFDIAAAFGAQMGRTVHPSTSLGRMFARDGQLHLASGWDGPPEAPDLLAKLRVEMDPTAARDLARRLAAAQNEAVTFIPCFEKRLGIFVQDGIRVRGWPAPDDPLWSAAPLGVEQLYCSLIVRGTVVAAP